MGLNCSSLEVRPATETTTTAVGSTAEPVVLHIYDIGDAGKGQVLNTVLRPLGLGAFHCGVEVYGREWSYSDVDLPNYHGTGVFLCQPRTCEGHSYSESINMGKTAFSRSEVPDMVKMLEKMWPARAYDILHRNCCHFCEDMLRRLGMGGLPPRVTNLAGAGAALADRAERVTQTVCGRTCIVEPAAVVGVAPSLLPQRDAREATTKPPPRPQGIPTAGRLGLVP